jgi:hypothetical protein
MADQAGVAPPGSRYQDQRHYIVVSTLDELDGPVVGQVALDAWLDWSGSPRYDLGDSGDVIVMYQTVLNDAQQPDDLRRWLNAGVLRRLWPSLWLPLRLRSLWEGRFPELAQAPRVAG